MSRTSRIIGYVTFVVVWWFLIVITIALSPVLALAYIEEVLT